MNQSNNKPHNLFYYNDKIDNRFVLETNINNDFEDSEKSLSLEDNHNCIPHLFENYLNAEKTDNNKEIVDDKNNLINNKEKDSEKIGVESFESKTTIIEKRSIFGRKRKEENKDIDNKGHDKFSDDNVRRKIKRLILSHLRKYINNQIKIKYNGEIGKGIFKKELYTLNQEQIANTNVTYNKLLLKKTLFEIFSVNITGRITNFSKDHNKIIINELINEKDKEKRNFFQNLFNLTFSDCLEYLRGDKYIEQLNGLELFSEFNEIKQDYLKKYNDGEIYVNQLKYYLKEYENLINKKNPRKSSKKRNKKYDD
jgi:hypothetical protein